MASVFDDKATKALIARWDKRLEKEGLGVIDNESDKNCSPEQVPYRRDIRINRWAAKREANLQREAVLLAEMEATFFDRATIIETYWPFSKTTGTHGEQYKLLVGLLTLPAKTKTLTIRELRSIPQLAKLSERTVERRRDALEAWINRFDFDSLSEWGPGTVCPDPVAFLMSLYAIPALLGTPSPK